MTSQQTEQTQQNPKGEIDEQHQPFLEKVMVEGGLSDLYDARDITEVVFRVMRDVMDTETVDHVNEDLHKEVLPTDNKRLQMEISELWKDTNPLVGFISRLRRPLKGPGLSGINSELFLTRVANEGGLPPTTNAETVIKAVFAATKAELSPEHIEEVTPWLPDTIQQIWKQA